MKKIIYIILYILCISCSTDRDGEIEHDYAFNDTELQLIDIINQHRVVRNLPQLNILPNLGYLCSKNNEEMVAIRNVCNCYLQQSANNIYRMYGTQHVSQIALAGYTDPQGAMNGILNNTSSKNIIEGNFTDIGAAITQHPTTGTKYYTILLIRR